MNSKYSIILPNELSIKTIDIILKPIIDKNMKCNFKKVNVDFRNVGWIEPTGVTVITNLIEWLLSQGVRISFERNTPEEASERNNNVMRYLDDSGFFQMYGLESYSGDTPTLRKTCTGIKKIKYKDYIQWNKNDFVFWLQRQTSSNSPFSNIQVAVEEIFNNINDHSEVNTGHVFAQFYPAYKIINISFSDFGLGIPSTIRHKKPSLNDSDLLEYAVQEGVSAQTTPGNRGAGLWNVIRNLTNENIGQVHICSNYGRIWYDNKEVKEKYESQFHYPGTFFEIKLNKDNVALYEDDEEEEFEW